MNQLKLRSFAVLAATAVVTACNGAPVASAGHDENVAETSDQLVFGLPKPFKWFKRDQLKVQLGPRPFYLVEDMDEGPLKQKLASCSEKEMRSSDPLQAHLEVQAASARTLARWSGQPEAIAWHYLRW